VAEALSMRTSLARREHRAHIDVGSAATGETNQKYELTQTQTAYGEGDICTLLLLQVRI
jgi:hypothetical protein